MVPSTRISVLDPATPLVDAVPALLAGGHRLAPVVTGGQLRGVITTGDVTRVVELATLHSTPVRRDEPAAPCPVPPDTSVRR
jgi:CBS-domain-containing membrane protein